MPTRRDFLRTGLTGVAGFTVLGAFGIPILSEENIHLTILHTNDMHSHLEPFADDHKLWPGQGGMAMRAALISKIRSQQENVLLLDAGDIFQGTPYFNVFGGEPEFKMMSKMGYDAATIGNHDFDNGLDGLQRVLPHANFPFLISNYDFSDTEMAGRTKPYKIFKKGGLKIGVFGIGIELAGLVDSKLYGQTRYSDPLEKSAFYSTLLKKEEKCDLVICLSHLGFRYATKKVSDLDLAKASEHIDLIIGGHTHTFLDQPMEVMNKKSGKVLIAQAGWAGLRLGRIDFAFNRKKNKKLATSACLSITKNCAKI